MDSPAIEFEMCVSTAYRLFSQMAISGSFQIAAMLMLSHTRPLFAPPSPKYPTATDGCCLHLHRKRRAHGDAEAGADNAVGAEEVQRPIDEVHAAAAAPRQAVVAAEQLSHHDAQRQALCQCVVVAAVGAGDDVVTCQSANRPDGDALLAFG